MLLSNVLGVTGLLGVVAAVWVLTGSPGWTLLVASLVLIALAYVGLTYVRPAQASSPPAASAAAATARHGRGGA